MDEQKQKANVFIAIMLATFSIMAGFLGALVTGYIWNAIKFNVIYPENSKISIQFLAAGLIAITTGNLSENYKTQNLSRIISGLLLVIVSGAAIAYGIKKGTELLPFECALFLGNALVFLGCVEGGLDKKAVKKYFSIIGSMVSIAAVAFVLYLLIGMSGIEIHITVAEQETETHTEIETTVPKETTPKATNTKAAEQKKAQSAQKEQVEKVIYDEDTNTLKIYFKGLNYYRAFKDVPGPFCYGLKNANNKTTYYTNHIRDKYDSTRVFPDTLEEGTKTTTKGSTQKELTEPEKAPHGYVKTYDENHNYTGLATWEELGLNHSNWDAEDFEHVSTPESTCFSEIGYDYIGKELKVIFRDSGAEYTYYGVPYNTWYELRDADSKGGYYNAEIKDHYSWQYGW